MRRESGDGFLGNLGRWTSGVREAERDLRAARYSEPRLAVSWASLAVSPTMVGQSRCPFRALSATGPKVVASASTKMSSRARLKRSSGFGEQIHALRPF
jgi:hypothetical protein